MLVKIIIVYIEFFIILKKFKIHKSLFNNLLQLNYNK